MVVGKHEDEDEHGGIARNDEQHHPPWDHVSQAQGDSGENDEHAVGDRVEQLT